MKKAVIILSGGMDSTTLAYDIAKGGKYDEIHAISFNYGQVHSKELECAKITAAKLGLCNHSVVDLSTLGNLLNSALTGNVPVPEGAYDDANQKLTVVPNRNMIMLSIAAGYAMSIGATDLYYGAHSGDHCLPGDEVVITPNGKCTISNLQIGDMVLSYDTKNHVTSFKQVTNKVSNGWRDDMLHISVKGGKHINLTSNHKVFRVNRSNFHQHSGWEKTIEEVEASELRIHDWVISPVIEYPIVDADTPEVMIDLLPYCDRSHPQLRYDNTHIWFKTNNKVNRFVDSRSFVRLLSWFIAEGSLPGDSQSNTYRMAISQSKDANPAYCNEIYELLEVWGFNYTHSMHSIYFSGPTTSVFRLCGDISFNKHIPNEFMMFHPIEWINTLIKGDGHIQEDKDTFVSSSTMLKEQVCCLSVVLGYSCNVSILCNGSYAISIKRVLNKRMNCIGGAKIHQIKEIQSSKPDEVYDITVDGNHNFFAGTGSGILVSNSIYPDCRQEFVEAMNTVLSVAHYTPVYLIVPYLHYGKGNIAALGRQLGVPYEDTWTCYKGGNISCGVCGSCDERKKAFEYAGFADPLEYQS